jgi:hypothetical protein
MPVKRAFLAAVMIAGSLSSAALEWSAFVRGSTRASNPLIISLLKNADLEMGLQIASSLGERGEPYIGDIIDAIASGYATRTDFERQYLLRVLIASLLRESLPVETVQGRIRVNLESLERLIQRMPELQDPLLKRELVRVVDLYPEESLIPRVSEQFRIILDDLNDNRGLIPLPDQALLVSLIAFAMHHPLMEFLSPCLEAARLSRDAEAVRNARAAASRIAESSRKAPIAPSANTVP